MASRRDAEADESYGFSLIIEYANKVNIPINKINGISEENRIYHFPGIFGCFTILSGSLSALFADAASQSLGRSSESHGRTSQ